MSTTITCMCNDETQMKKTACFQCKKEWMVAMEYHERVMACPKRHQGFAFCGGNSPPLCQQCTEEGYKVKSDGHGMFASFSVVKE